MAAMRVITVRLDEGLHSDFMWLVRTHTECSANQVMTALVEQVLERNRALIESRDEYTKSFCKPVGLSS